MPDAHAAVQAAVAQAAELRAAVAARDAELASRGAALRQLANECAAAQEQAHGPCSPARFCMWHPFDGEAAYPSAVGPSLERGQAEWG